MKRDLDDAAAAEADAAATTTTMSRREFLSAGLAAPFAAAALGSTYFPGWLSSVWRHILAGRLAGWGGVLPVDVPVTAATAAASAGVSSLVSGSPGAVMTATGMMSGAGHVIGKVGLGPVAVLAQVHAAEATPPAVCDCDNADAVLPWEPQWEIIAAVAPATGTQAVL